MNKNPLINALAVVLYIALVASFMFYGPALFANEGKPDTVLAPIAMISLFVLSASVMAYIFCFIPIRMYIDGEKKEAVNLFLKTVAIFACVTVFLFAVLAFLG